MQKARAIAVVGPTASGKTALGIFLAQKLGGEIVSADSRQTYKQMRVISRAPTATELRTIPHHMVSVAAPGKAYSASEYTAAAHKAIQKILDHKHVPIVVGGAGFYAEALLRGLSLPEVAPNPKLRRMLEKKSATDLHMQLAELDPESAARVGPHNAVRLVRAIEIATALGKVPMLTENPPYRTLWLGILPNPKTYKAVLRKGVENRLKKGMVAEVQKLRAALSKKQFAALGFEFSALADYIDKKVTRQELIANIVQFEQTYAKRQMRWFARRTDIVWVKNKTEALRHAKAFLSSGASVKE